MYEQDHFGGSRQVFLAQASKRSAGEMVMLVMLDEIATTKAQVWSMYYTEIYMEWPQVNEGVRRRRNSRMNDDDWGSSSVIIRVVIAPSGQSRTMIQIFVIMLTTKKRIISLACSCLQGRTLVSNIPLCPDDK